MRYYGSLPVDDQSYVGSTCPSIWVLVETWEPSPIFNISTAENAPDSVDSHSTLT